MQKSHLLALEGTRRKIFNRLLGLSHGNDIVCRANAQRGAAGCTNTIRVGSANGRREAGLGHSRVLWQIRYLAYKRSIYTSKGMHQMSNKCAHVVSARFIAWHTHLERKERRKI